MTTWRHFVGGRYTPDRFVQEAKVIGVTRRVAAALAKSMAFGDTVQLLYWRHGRPVLFAEFTITTITLPDKIAAEVARQTGKKVKPSGQNGGQRIVRECGSYKETGTLIIEPDDQLTLSDLVAKAILISKEKGIAPWVMIGGPLKQVFDPVLEVQPAPKFSRGFTRIERSTSTTQYQSTTLKAVEDYQKRRHKARRDLQISFPTF